MWDRPGGWHTIDHGWWPGLIHELVPLLFLAAFVLLAVWAVRRITDERRMLAVAPVAPVAPGAADSAMQELRLRYARGEVDRDEFVQRVRDLGGEGPEPPPPTPPAAA
jgi:putative membrane protein